VAKKLDIDRLKRELHLVTDDEFFLQVAGQVSSRSSSDERRQGALLVKNGSIIGMGCFNGYEGEAKNMGVGAIELAIAGCARTGVSIENSILYTYSFPNDVVCRMLWWADIGEIVYVKPRADDNKLGRQLCEKAGIKLTQITRF